ncbi:class I SAM-dependent methyltransferase [Saccharibacillus sp. CPCC 101409]|uniref:class I SAM-dependent methyltransferase n=1 Tax=Saccharibacillus sp. CPCC 101409 TaxID=3058041 RepID=UPI002673B40D|nr:class I SAM-dependent methyltransferase [Saccharibacillus sp. CPCC 101409]MDO3408363.1 class I SAM-dependent methyltransferase [Saccharibacillus sp. CPCC 101409]
MSNEVGHRFLAKLGKKRLRPGGVEATSWLLGQGEFTSESRVLEVACNMCTTSIELAQRYRCQITGVDLDSQALQKAESHIRAAGMESHIRVMRGNAMKLPFEDESFDIVINEAMLTMLNRSAKEKAVAEYWRVLKPGGRLLTHDITLVKPDMASAIAELRQTIHVHVEPMPVGDWESLMRGAGFVEVDHRQGAMTLMNARGMIRDEGLLGTLRIVRNGMKKDNRRQFRSMSRFFNTVGRDLNYIAVCSRKPNG